MKKRTIKPVKAWAGFEGGRLQWWGANDGYTTPAESPQLYRSKKQARSRYEDVRRVEIRLITKRKK